VIDLGRDGDVWILRMADGENRFNRQWLDAVSAALDRAEAAGGAAALVTTGDRKFYSNGMDLDWLATLGAEADGFLAEVSHLFARLLGFPMVTVAAVNGHAFGAGAVLAVAHDLIVMREDRGYWCLPEADLGFPVTPAMFAVIAAKLPRRTAQEAILTGRRYGGPDAAAAGIVHRVAGEDHVLAGPFSWPPGWRPRNAGHSRSTSACCMARRSRPAEHEQPRCQR
jgi:Delta3-Delta2-enoyl-CoA isomerase